MLLHILIIFIIIIIGLMALEVHFVVQRIARALATKWRKSYGMVMGWVQTRRSFAILRATNLCVRGSRVKWRSGTGMEDGAGLALTM